MSATTTYQREIATSFRTVAEMIRDRGVPESRFAEMSNEDIIAVAGGKQVFHIDDARSGYRLVYEMNAKFRLVNIRKLLENTPDDIHTVLVVVKDMPTPAARASVQTIRDVAVEFFDIRQLQYNPARHVLVPKHEPVRDEAEIQAILSHYFVKSRFQLPIILTTDPMAVYLALKHGQLVRITRTSPTAGVHTFYRCCMRCS